MGRNAGGCEAGMFRKLIRSLVGEDRAARKAAAGLRSIDPAILSHTIQMMDGLPHLDWGMVDAWIQRNVMEDSEIVPMRRAFAAGWLDALSEALGGEYRRWRHTEVEGLAPLAGNLGPETAMAADRAIAVIQRALRPIRGDMAIPPVAIIALEKLEQYYTLIAPLHPDEGAFATSGGIFTGGSDGTFPAIIFPCVGRHEIGSTIAHELTHHALAGLSLPQWLEEGYTQMMEERVTNTSNFHLTREIHQRHKEHWPEAGIDRFFSGDAFMSPEEDEQELAYNLAQAIVRGMLTERSEAFFAFTRACGTLGAEAAALKHLGMRIDELAERIIGPDGSGDSYSYRG